MPNDRRQDSGEGSGSSLPGRVYPFPFRKLDIPASIITEVNNMLDWRAGTLLNGQILGRLGVTSGKRTEIENVPDRRIVKLHEFVNLTGKSILEVGCFEGIHTMGLRLYSDDVTAVDIRPSNVIKTMTRLSMHGCHAKVFLADVENLSENFGRFDLIFHCGVLYHLMSPVEHLLSLGRMCRQLFLDTHVARDEKEMLEKESAGFFYRGALHREAGWEDPFSGKDATSLWLDKPSLEETLQRAGFSSVRVLETREERNGPRLAILATR